MDSSKIDMNSMELTDFKLWRKEKSNLTMLI